MAEKAGCVAIAMRVGVQLDLNDPGAILLLDGRWGRLRRAELARNVGEQVGVEAGREGASVELRDLRAALDEGDGAAYPGRGVQVLEVGALKP
jgi:hypothetical protein